MEKWKNGKSMEKIFFFLTGIALKVKFPV